jgi:hypothetical protein
LGNVPDSGKDISRLEFVKGPGLEVTLIYAVSGIPIAQPY